MVEGDGSAVFLTLCGVAVMYGEDFEVCSTTCGGGPAGNVSLWAAALFCGGMMIFWRWRC